MSFKDYLKKKLKYVLGVATLAALVSQLVLPIININAAEPRFNFLDGDKELIRGANVTAGDTIYKNPVSGTPGDEFKGLIYYHNGMVDTTAKNTTIRVNLPASTTNKTAKITASISADNAETVTSTIVDGQIVGMDGLVVKLDQDADLQLVPGSVKWFPNANELGTETPTRLPDSQTGNEIVSKGVNIGDVNGCWQYAGFVSFSFKTITKAKPALALTKNVRNESAGEKDFVKNTNAVIGDEVEYKINVQNTGNIKLEDAILQDNLPVGLIFESGSLKEGSTNISDADATKMFGNGLCIGDVAVGETKTFTFQAQVSKSVVAGALVNVATVKANNLSATDKATVNVLIGKIVKSKSAYNDTKKAPASTVSSLDLVTFTLKAQNDGNGPVDFVFVDDIANVLQFADVVAISDNGQINQKSSEIVWPSVKIEAGKSVAKTFQVKIRKDAAAGLCFKNVFGNEVVLCVEKKVVNPNLSIEKLVRDVSTGEGNFLKANQAFAGDTLEYEIVITNSGDGPADDVLIRDLLPANTSYVAGSTRIVRNNKAEQTLPDGLTNKGITLETICSGEAATIKFKVVIDSGVAAGETLVNTANLTHKGKTISDTAKTTIVAKSVPVKPAELPVTGATGAGSFIVTFLTGIGFLYGKYRMLLNSQELAIVVDLLK